MGMTLTKEQEKANREKVWHTKDNGCTDKMLLHPVRCQTDIYWRDDGNNEHVIDKGKCFGSLIHFDTRQVWECYFVGFCNPEWNCERANLVLRMSPNDFKRIFGEIKIVNHEPERLALIRQGRTDVGIALV